MKAFAFLLLAAILPLSAAEISVAGKWSGTLNVTSSEGETRDMAVVLELKQDGAGLTGAVGPADKDQLPIQKGKIDGNKLTFEVQNDDVSVKFALALDGGHIKGDVTGSDHDHTFKGKVDFTRAQ